MKSKMITLDQVQLAYTKLRDTQKAKERVEVSLATAFEEFDNLVNRASQKVLAEFVRKGEL